MTAGGRARSITDRIRHAAEAQGVDPQRLRRRLVFQRILARLAHDDAWVLKGGFCLEVRFDLSSRATKDLDMVARDGWGVDGAFDLQDALDIALDVKVDDGFTFVVARPRSVSVDAREAWRVSVEARLDGVTFAQVRIDVVVQYDELVGGIELLRVPAPVSGLGVPDVEVPAVDVDQHAAEKIHAYSRTYAGDRPSSRVKDLVDLVLLIEAGVLDHERLRRRLTVVYQRRDGADPPGELPQPPTSWLGDYTAMLAEHALGVSATTLEAAHHLLATTYAATITPPPEEDTTA